MPKKPDLTGKKFGRLTVIEKLPISKNPTYWNCICECGKNKITTYTSLNTGLTQSCGCYRIDQVIKKCRINLAGKKFGRLTVINETSHHKNRTAWNCLCDCGKKAIAITSSLRNGMTRSCGCIRRERLKTHGMSLSSEYLKWQNMMQRCYYKNSWYLYRRSCNI